MTDFDPKNNQELRDYWNEEDITPDPEVIVCAANVLNGNIMVCGARHWDRVMLNQAELIGGEGRWWTEEEQGFINQYGEFRTRKQAMEIIKETGQLFNIDRNGGDCRLFSEGLY